MKKRGRRSSSSTHLLEGLQQQQSIDIIYKVCSFVHLRELLNCFSREPVGRPSLQLRRQSSGHFESKLQTFVSVIRSDVQRQAERFADVQKETRDLQHVTFSLLDLLSVKLHVFQDLFCGYILLWVLSRIWATLDGHTVTWLENS